MDPSQPAPRISPALPPYPTPIQAALDHVMPAGMAPLVLFQTMARDERLFGRFMGGGLLDRGQLSLREREIAILRTCARCRSEYEWGVHVTVFAHKAGLSPEAIAATVGAETPVDAFTPAESCIVALMDALHDTQTVSDELWSQLRGHYSDPQLLELFLLAGFYHTVSYLTNGLRLPLEAFGARFPE